MTKLLLEIPNPSDLEVLLPLLRRLNIRYSKVETVLDKKREMEEALRVIRDGCDMGNFGDALEWQIEVRNC